MEKDVSEFRVQSFLERVMREPHLWAGLIILISALTRLWFVGTDQLDLVQDEAQYWDWTRRIQLTYYSKGGLIAWIIWFWTRLFGDTELGVRFGSFVGSVGMQTLLYWGLAKLWKRPGMGLVTLVVANTMPFFLALGVLMTTDNPLLLCWTAAVFALWAAARPNGKGNAATMPFFWIVLALGVGILAKFTMLGFVGLAVIYGLLLARRGELPRRSGCVCPRPSRQESFSAFCPPSSGTWTTTSWAIGIYSNWWA